MKDLNKFNFDNYLFRASSVGNLMVGIDSGRTKIGNLSKTSQTFLNKLFYEVIFDKKKEISTKQMDKGTYVEEASISLYSEVSDTLFFKNEKRFKNDYVAGTPDMANKKIVDIKSSWDIYTFPMFEETLKNNIYKWQVLSYMWLTDLHTGEVAYCLVDTPDHLIFDEIRRFMWKNNLMDISEEQEEEIRKNLTFSEIPKELRVKIFPVIWSEEEVEKLKIQITSARIYLNNLLTKIKSK
jgi:hypothetical protein